MPDQVMKTFGVIWDSANSSAIFRPSIVDNRQVHGMQWNNANEELIKRRILTPEISTFVQPGRGWMDPAEYTSHH